MSSFAPYPKVVFITSRFPFPLEKGDKLRAYYQIKEISKSCEVHLIALSNQPVKKEHKAELEKFCGSVTIYQLSKLSIFWNVLMAFFGNKPLQVGYFYNASNHRKIEKLLNALNPDHVIAQLVRTTEYVKNYHKCPKTLDYMDALSKGIDRRINKQKWYSKWIFKLEAKRLQNYERSVFDYFEHKIIISLQDRDYIFHPDRKKIGCVPNGIDDSFLTYKTSKKPTFDLVFVGNMSYAPNVEAVKYIAEKILTEMPELSLLVAGATPHPSIIQLATKSKQITIAGWVEDIREAYTNGKIFLAPMTIGTGMQNKLLEAMALGIPCITTDLANNAIHAQNNESILVANNQIEILQAIQNLMNNEPLRNEIGNLGRNYIQSHFSWQESTKLMLHLIHKSTKNETIY